MSSEKQIKANKLNSKRSTGPKTTDGKSAVSKNSLQHGLLSKETLLPWENVNEYNKFAALLKESLSPENTFEAILVDRIISLTWRLRRSGRIETGILVQQRYNLNAEVEKSRIKEKDKKLFNLFVHLNANVAIEKHPDLLDLGMIFSEEADNLTKLQRYETTLERSLYKAWHELERSQAKRRGEPASLPITLDINSDFDK